MKFRKTRFNERDTYTYVYKDEKGRIIDKVVLCSGEGGVTEVDIKMLHSWDDREVNNNIKNSRPKVVEKQKEEKKAWREKYIADFRTKYGYEPNKADVDAVLEEVFPKNWNLSVDALVDEGIDQDKSSILADVSYSPFSEIKTDIDRLREVVQLLTPEQQEIYRRVLIEGEPAQDVAAEMGIPSKQAMNNRLNKIKAQIKKLF